MKRILALLYGAVAYVTFLASFLYAIAWLGGFIVPKRIDSGTPAGLPESIAMNLLLLTAFALQHSVMARPAFKRWWTRFVSPCVERSTFVLAASVLLFAVCLAWRPLPTVVWHADGTGSIILSTLFWIGWLIVLSATFMVSHWDLFGLRQVWLYARNRSYTAPHYVERFLYRFVRHPIMLGFLMAFWASPVMSAGHLLFAIVTTAYILVALQFEERDLLVAHGGAYADYRARVPMLLPWTNARHKMRTGVEHSS